MSKRFTKIICGVVAVISACALAIAPGCSNGWRGADAKDTATQAVAGTNGGFVVETEDYAYFINGKSVNTQDNSFGSVVKGSVQRIAKSDLTANNYTNTTTIVPSVIYSGKYDAGLYIYNGYLYYTTPSTQVNTSGEVLNSRLDFKRTKLDGTDTTNGYIWQSESNSVDYRYVEVDGVVYILYAKSESLYGSSKTNIHSVNCETGVDTLLAYGVSAYSFDTEDPENPYVYYTMDVPVAMGESSTYDYNQLYRVRADVTESPREYDFSRIEDYDAETDPVYINMGDFVLDGIGKIRASQGLTQFNCGYQADGVDQKPVLTNGDYTYGIQWYKNGELYFTRNESALTQLYKLSDSDVDADGDGKVDASWNAITENNDVTLFISENYTTEYTFVTMEGVLYAVETSSTGIFKKPMNYDSVNNSYSFGESILMSRDTSATPLFVKEHSGHIYLYYSMTGGNGYTVYRLAIDGESDNYNKLPVEENPDYKGVQVLDIDACSGWYLPEFVGNTLLFASEVEGMSDYNYIMACDLTGENGIMTNAEIEELNERYDAIEEKIADFDSKTNSDGSKTYENLAGALRYEFYTRDGSYLGELMQAFVDVEGKELNYYYSEESVQIAKDFIDCTGDWATDEDGNAYLSKTINGEEVKSNKRDYYYSLVGQMSEEDAESYADYFKNNTSYMKAYPVDNSTWWEKLSTGGKVGFIIGMVAAGLVVIGGVVVLVIFLVRRKKMAAEGGESTSRMRVDISDDKDIDVYGEDKE
ncbi:MAG: hypothetical protein ACI4VK_01130 [Candidatus Coproplasma sp.]